MSRLFVVIFKLILSIDNDDLIDLSGCILLLEVIDIIV